MPQTATDKTEEHRRIFIQFITRQLHRMTLEDLRTVYDTTSEIVDRRKGVTDERGHPLYRK